MPWAREVGSWGSPSLRGSRQWVVGKDPPLHGRQAGASCLIREGIAPGAEWPAASCTEGWLSVGTEEEQRGVLREPGPFNRQLRPWPHAAWVRYIKR